MHTATTFKKIFKSFLFGQYVGVQRRALDNSSGASFRDKKKFPLFSRDFLIGQNGTRNSVHECKILSDIVPLSFPEIFQSAKMKHEI